MASFEEAFVAYMTSRADVRALVASRVYDTTAPQGAELDYITFQEIDERDEPHFGGVHDEHPFFVQVDYWAADAKRRREGAIVVRTAMRAWKGEWAGFRVARAFKETDYPTTEPSATARSLPIFRRVTRWKVIATDPALTAP